MSPEDKKLLHSTVLHVGLLKIAAHNIWNAAMHLRYVIEALQAATKYGLGEDAVLEAAKYFDENLGDTSSDKDARISLNSLQKLYETLGTARKQLSEDSSLMDLELCRTSYNPPSNGDARHQVEALNTYEAKVGDTFDRLIACLRPALVTNAEDNWDWNPPELRGYLFIELPSNDDDDTDTYREFPLFEQFFWRSQDLIGPVSDERNQNPLRWLDNDHPYHTLANVPMGQLAHHLIDHEHLYPEVWPWLTIGVDFKFSGNIEQRIP